MKDTANGIMSMLSEVQSRTKEIHRLNNEITKLKAENKELRALVAEYHIVCLAEGWTKAAKCCKQALNTNGSEDK